MLTHNEKSQHREILFFHGELTRFPRVSLLCFIDCNGLVESFLTDGTFDRMTFLRCCGSFALSWLVQQYTGMRSIWILDRARIHCHPSFTYYLRSIGIIPILCPAYCPMYSPIEYFFGIVKSQMRRFGCETSTRPKDMPKLVSSILNRFVEYNIIKVFQHCGFSSSACFNPGIAFENDSLANFGFAWKLFIDDQRHQCSRRLPV